MTKKPAAKPAAKPVAKATVTTYRILAMAGLGLVFLSHSDPDRAISMSVLVAVGFAVLYLPRFLGSGVFLVLLAFIELFTAHRWPANRFVQPAFDLPEMMLAAGTLLFVGSLHRLHALLLTAATYDPRLAKKSPRPLPPQTRPASALSTQEIVGWLMTVPLCVLAAELLRRGLNRPTPLEGLVPWQIAHVIIAVWVLVVGVLFVWTMCDYWRRTNRDPDLARMYLEDMAWRESRRDQGRMGRWLAWRRRKSAD
jgi:hypothetical protein